MAYSTKNCMVNEEEAKRIRIREVIRKAWSKKLRYSFEQLLKQIKDEEEQEKRES